MPSHIALRGLPIENLKRKPFRTGALLAVVTILALTFFGGTMLTMNLNTGMTSMEKRLGADLMVVPQNTVQKAEALLTNGNPSTFYFTKDIADEVMQADGIAQATEQTYISSLAAACCAEKLQIIGYDPDTDFVIEPWVASQFEGPLEDGQMIAGANVHRRHHRTLRPFMAGRRPARQHRHQPRQLGVHQPKHRARHGRRLGQGLQAGHVRRICRQSRLHRDD